MIQLPMFSDESTYKYTIDIDDGVFGFRFYFNARSETWRMDIESEDGETLAGGIPLLVNTDLLAFFSNPDLPAGSIYLIDNLDTGAEMGFQNVDDYSLIYIPDGEIE